MLQVKVSCQNSLSLNKDNLESWAVVFSLLCITNHVSLCSGRAQIRVLEDFPSTPQAREII